MLPQIGFLQFIGVTLEVVHHRMLLKAPNKCKSLPLHFTEWQIIVISGRFCTSTYEGQEMGRFWDQPKGTKSQMTESWNEGPALSVQSGHSHEWLGICTEDVCCLDKQLLTASNFEPRLVTEGTGECWWAGLQASSETLSFPCRPNDKSWFFFSCWWTKSQLKEIVHQLAALVNHE
jgi:hypothetical protein